MTAADEPVVGNDHRLADLVSYPEFCPIEAGLQGKLADNECRHGRLPGDRTQPCGCWPQEPTPSPAPAVTKEDAMELSTSIATDEEAK